MAEVAAAAIVGGTILEMTAQSKASKAKSEAARLEGDAKRQQAFDLEERFNLNSNSLRLSAQKTIGDQIAASADIGRGDSPLLLLEETNLNTQYQIDLDRFELNAQQDVLIRGAELSDKTARSIDDARGAQQTSTFLNGIGRLRKAGGK